MKEINIDVLKEASEKLMFKMEDKEYETLLAEFETILKQMSLISNILGVDDVVPMTFPYEVKKLLKNHKLDKRKFLNFVKDNDEEFEKQFNIYQKEYALE